MLSATCHCGGVRIDHREKPRAACCGKRVRTVNPRAFIACTLLVLVPAVPAPAQNSKCRVEPFQGATLPSGAVVQMRVVNTGAACAIVNYGVPAEKLNPADSGSITTQAAHGKAEFVAPAAKYTPERGFVGEDAVEYDAFARGNTGQPVSLKVKVKVVVVAR